MADPAVDAGDCEVLVGEDDEELLHAPASAVSRIATASAGTRRTNDERGPIGPRRLTPNQAMRSPRGCTRHVCDRGKLPAVRTTRGARRKVVKVRTIGVVQTRRTLETHARLGLVRSSSPASTGRSRRAGMAQVPSTAMFIGSRP